MNQARKNIMGLIPVFSEVARQGSFTKAAEKLNISKSAVSQQICKLEEILDVQLFTRFNHDIHLTTAGENLLKKNTELESLIDTLSGSIMNDLDSYAGEVSVTASYALAHTIVIPAVKELVDQHPDVLPKIVVDDDYRDIIKEGIDIAIRVGPLPNSDLKSRKIGDLKNIFVVSPNSKIPTEGIGLKDIEELPFIANSWQQTVQYLEVHDAIGNVQLVPFRPAYYSNSASVTLELVTAGLGITLLPDILVKQHLNNGKLIHILEEYSGEKRAISYLHPFHTRVPSKVRLLIELISSRLSRG